MAFRFFIVLTIRFQSQNTTHTDLEGLVTEKFSEIIMTGSLLLLKTRKSPLLNEIFCLTL